MFVGRIHEQQCYQELLDGDSPWVLMITGLASNGKSTLLHRLAENTPPAIPVMTLNFADPSLRTDPLVILEYLAQQVSLYCDALPMQTFEKALQEGRAELAARHHMSETIIASGQAVVHGNQLTMNASEQRRQVHERVRKAFYDLVDTFRPTQLVLMLDTCEWFKEPECVEVGQWILH